MTREEQVIKLVDDYREGDLVATKLLNRNAAFGLVTYVLEWADSHPNWISVEERLPPLYERVLVAGLDKRSKLKEVKFFVTSRVRRHDGVHDGNGFDVTFMPSAYKRITHWMPIVPPVERKE